MGWIKKVMSGKEPTRDSVLDEYRRRGLPEEDLPPIWHQELTLDLWNNGGVPGVLLWDLVNSSEPYPQAVPILLDWLANLDARMEGPETRWNRVTREGLIRALTVTDAKGTCAVDLMLSQFENGLVSNARTLYAAGNAASELAGPECFDRIAEIVNQRYPGRERLIEWLAKSRKSGALDIVVDQLDDPQVAPFVMRILRRKKKSLAEDVRLRVKPLLNQYKDYPGDPDLLPGELRKQAKLTLEALFPDE